MFPIKIKSYSLSMFIEAWSLRKEETSFNESSLLVPEYNIAFSISAPCN
jgi:hypothetical protein